MSKRYEREIEDLLRGLERRLGTDPLPSPKRAPGSTLLLHVLRVWNLFLAWNRAEQFMVTALTLALLTWLFGLFSQTLAFYAALLGGAVSVLALTAALGNRRPYTAREPRWRGRQLDLRPHRAGVWWQLVAWWRRIMR